MNNDFFLWKLAQERQRELLKEAEVNRLLKEAGVDRPRPLAHKVLVALCIAAPFALLIARAAAAAAGGGGGGGGIHLVM